VEPLTSDDPSRVGQYRVHARLGAGGMGAVYLAFTPGGRPIALKVIRPELADNVDFRNRFRQEVEAARRVHGFYTAQVLGADPDASPPWLATAFVPGLNLQEAVSAHGRLPVDTVLVLMAGVAEALQVIHNAGVVHRDLKPSNVVLAPDGPRVIDFGIARAADAGPLTGGIRIGSPQYMAPEQVAEKPVGPAADVFALGSVAAYAALGRPAFGEGGPLPVMYRVLHEPADLTDCPFPLRDIIEHCLAKDPDERPSPAEVISRCRDVTAGRTGEIAQPWLPPALANGQQTSAAASAHPAASPAAAAHPTARLKTRRSRRSAWPAALVLGLLAAAAAALTLLADGNSPAARSGAGGATSPPAAAAWLAGTWTGSASQPTGVVTHWSAQLTFIRSGRVGTFRFPSLGCSGTLIVTGLTPTTASVYENLTRDPRKVCAVGGFMTLSRSGPTGMRMRWRDATDGSNLATGYLRSG
jgi:serine/threonine kinase PknH